MKNLIKLIITLCICFNVFSQTDGHVVLYKYTPPQNFISYKNDTKQFVTNSLELYKTYNIGDDTFEVIGKENEKMELLFSNGSVVQFSSEFRVNLYSTTILSTNYPKKLTVENFSMNFSLEGEAIFVIPTCSTNDQIILQTPISTLGLHQGKYFVQSTKKTTLVYIIEGKLDTYDSLTNKKRVVESGNAVLVQSIPSLSQRQQEFFGDTITTTVKKAKQDQLKLFQETANKLEVDGRDFIFININSNVFGVSLK
jgi:hypothetical protein